MVSHTILVHDNTQNKAQNKAQNEHHFRAQNKTLTTIIIYGSPMPKLADCRQKYASNHNNPTHLPLSFAS